MTTTFHEFRLIPALIEAVAIPVGLAGRDLIGCASTGTGKTAAFLLPILQRLHTGARGKCRALILSPTRELAMQIAELVVATPGRLLDHMRFDYVDFSALEVLVLDEADRMLDMGFLPDIRRILRALPEE